MSKPIYLIAFLIHPLATVVRAGRPRVVAAATAGPGSSAAAPRHGGSRRAARAGSRDGRAGPARRPLATVVAPGGLAQRQPPRPGRAGPAAAAAAVAARDATASAGTPVQPQRNVRGASRMRMSLAGIPPTTALLGTLAVTTELVPMTALSPTRTPRSRQAP